jgi:mercuric reductase
MQNYELIIIGGGTGAFAAAVQANRMGASTALVNSGLPLGGTCVNVGCVPSKALLRAGEVMHLARRHGIPGIELELKSFDFAEVVQDELHLVDELRNQKYEDVLDGFTNVTVIDGTATFVDDHEIEVAGQRLRAERFILASGSTATVPPIPGLREAGFLTHVEALRLDRQPAALAIIGGGPLGVEFAQMYARFGTEVTVLQRAGSILPAAEPELSARLTEVLTGEGIAVATGVQVERVRRDGQARVVSYRHGGQRGEVTADAVLVAAGKTPNTRSMGLGAAGVDVDGGQAVKVDPQLRTSQPHIFAIGDVTDQPRRQNPTAGREGTLAAENALSGARHRIDYDHAPTTVFTDPQLASVGVTEAEQLRRTGAAVCREVPFEYVPKAVITRRTEGMIKMVIIPGTKRIVGVHILAPGAGDLITAAMIALRNHNTIDDLADSLPMYPTMSEALKLAALSFTRDITEISCGI